MAILSYIIWNGSPEIFSVGSFGLRWYGLFFALGFLISQQILYYIYKKENKPESDVDTLTIYMVIATIIGARLGHVLFYQRELIWEDPVSIFLPFEFSPFRFTGLQGLASHGAAIGIFVALWLYSRKKKPGQSYLQVLDRIAILVALTGALIRFGNYFNSEIIGKPTDQPWGVVFAGRLTESIEDKRIDPDEIVDDVVYIKNDTVQKYQVGKEPILIYIFFKPEAKKGQIDALVNGQIRPLLQTRLLEYFEEPPELRLDYEVAKPDEKSGYVARVRTIGIARHPAQLYESISCVFLSIFLFWLWIKKKENLAPGRLFGIFLLWCFSLRFLFEFLKEPQAAFEADLPINMGQILSIPLIIAGLIILILSFRNKAQQNS